MKPQELKEYLKELFPPRCNDCDRMEFTYIRKKRFCWWRCKLKGNFTITYSTYPCLNVKTCGAFKPKKIIE